MKFHRIIGILKGKEIYGLSHRYGILFSIEKAGVFLIIHFNHIRNWIGIGNKIEKI